MWILDKMWIFALVWVLYQCSYMSSKKLVKWDIFLEILIDFEAVEVNLESSEILE